MALGLDLVEHEPLALGERGQLGLGGLGSAFGALVGSLIIGIVTELSTVWIPNDLRYAVALLILILVLLVRPQGVLGRKERVG